MKYILITNSDIDCFAQLVNTWIAEGWKPLGGVSITKDQGCTLYAQALTRA